MKTAQEWIDTEQIREISDEEYAELFQRIQEDAIQEGMSRFINQADREKVLLRAAYDLLKKAEESEYVEESANIEVFYDNADCSGHCLMQDIATLLDLEPDTQPIKRGEHV